MFIFYHLNLLRYCFCAPLLSYQNDSKYLLFYNHHLLLNLRSSLQADAFSSLEFECGASSLLEFRCFFAFGLHHVRVSLNAEIRLRLWLLYRLWLLLAILSRVLFSGSLHLLFLACRYSLMDFKVFPHRLANQLDPSFLHILPDLPVWFLSAADLHLIDSVWFPTQSYSIFLLIFIADSSLHYPGSLRRQTSAPLLPCLQFHLLL